MTFFICSISAEVCRGKKKQICGFVIASEVWGVCSINGWDGLDEQEKSCLDFFFKMISDRVSRLRLWQRAASSSMCFRLQGRSSSSSPEWRENLQMNDVAVRPGAPRYFNLLLQKETSTSNVRGASWRSLTDVFMKTAKHFSALTSPDKTY